MTQLRSPVDLRALFSTASLAAVLLGACSESAFSGSTADEGGSGGGGQAGSSPAGASPAAGQSGEPSSGPGGGGAGAGEGGAAGEASQSSAGDGPLGGGGGVAGTSSGGGTAGSAAGSGGGPTGAKAFSDFVASDEGWTITGDPTVTKPKHSVALGNPDGFISATDSGTGSWFFSAPDKFNGDISAFEGGVVSFDLKVTAITEAFEWADVQLTTAGLTLVYDVPTNPTTSWKTYTVPLTVQGWHVTTFDGPAATQAQFTQVLSNLTRLRIRGEYNTGEDTGSLDNVYLGAKLPAASE